MGRHHAGGDLTQALAGAPHGPEVLERVPELGPAPSALGRPGSPGPAPAGDHGLHRAGPHAAHPLLPGLLELGPALGPRPRAPGLGSRPRPAWDATARPPRGFTRTGPAAATPHSQVSCLHCHSAQPQDPDVSQAHYRQYERGDSKWGTAQYRVPVATVVTPKDCARCHPDQAKQYDRLQARQHHRDHVEAGPLASTRGLNSDFERVNGCFHCHGTVLKLDDKGRLDQKTWPNLGRGTHQPGRLQGLLHLLPHPPPLQHGRGPQARDLRPVPPGARPSPDGDLQ